MATGTDVITKIRDELQDADDESISDAVLLRYINRGATEFATQTGAIQDTDTINTDAVNFSFTLSASLTNPIKIFKVEYNGVPLSQTFVHEVSYEFGSSSGTPTSQTGWYEFAGKLYIEVIAPVATGSSALNVFYFRTPTDMTSVGDTFDFPDIWQPAIVQYGIAKGFASQRDSVLSAQHMARYEAMKQAAFAVNKNLLLGDAA
jgi:hypothetical protein